MNRFQKFISRLIGLKQYQPGVRYSIENGVLVNDPDNKKSYLDNGYLINDLIYSITGLITNKIKVANWGLYRVEDESSLKELNAIRRKRDFLNDDYTKALRLHSKALKPIEDSRLTPLLEYPNDYCTFQDLVADSSLFKMITGDRFIWAERLGMGANEGKPMSLNILPSHLVTIIANKMVTSGTPLIRPVGYQITQWGVDKIALEDVIHDKYFNPDYTQMGSHLYGMAPLKAALKLTTRSNSANKAATAAFANGGPKVVIFNDSEVLAQDAKLAKEQIGSLKTQIANEYAGADNYNKVAVSGWKTGAVPIGLSPVELGIIESEKWDLRRFCNVFFGVPSQLLNDPENKTYNNQQEGESALTSRCALPLMNDFRNAFNKKLKEWGYADKNIYVDYDMTCYTELQDDNKTKWEWVRELPVSNRYKLDLMGLDYEEGAPGLDEIFIPQNQTRLEDMLMSEVESILRNERVNGQANGEGR